MLYSVGDVIHYTSDNRPYSAVIVIRNARSSSKYDTDEFLIGSPEMGGTYDEWYLRDKCTIHGVYKSIDEFKYLNPEFFI